MTDTTKMTRLGDILLEKGLLSSSQLQEAVREQQRRRERIDPNDKVAFDATSLGEVLIDLGYINRQQLKRGLNWQLYLRNMTLVMSLCAPLMSIGAAAAPSKPKNSSMSSQSIASSSSVAAQSSSPSSSSAYSVPLTIQAEDYTTMSGVEVEPSSDVGGGMNVAYIHDGDWMSYTGTAVNVPTTGTYKITFRLASPLGGGSFAFHEADGSIHYGTVTVPASGGSQTWVDVVHTVTLTAGVHKFRITALTRGSGFNINWFKIEAAAVQPPPASSSSTQSSAASSQVAAVSSTSTSSMASVASSLAPPPVSSAATTSSSSAPSVSSSAPSIPASSSSAPVTSTASSSVSSVNSLPFKIQAESYTSMSGIEVEPSSDVDGGMNVAYIHDGDWMSYSGAAINAPVAGTYKVTFRLASPLGGGSFAFHEADGSVQYGTVTVPATGSSQTWVDVEHTITLTAGVHRFGITALARGSGFNINWFNIEFKGQPLPATIQAENYSTMMGIETEPTNDQGGGLNVAYIHEGDWMSYANNLIDIPTAGTYKVVYRLASPGGYGRFAFHEADGSVQYDTVDVPDTGSSQQWVDVVRTVYLTAGVHKFGITALERGAGFNINWFRIENNAVQPPPLPNSSSSVSSKAASSTAVSSSSSSVAASVASSIVSSNSSAPSISSSSSSIPAIVTSASSSSAASSSGAQEVSGSVHLQWNIPIQRENGEPLYSNELGGYELRYRKLPDTTFTYITIEAWKTEHIFAWLEGTYEFEIAAFDINGLYSHFVPLPPRT